MASLSPVGPAVALELALLCTPNYLLHFTLSCCRKICHREPSSRLKAKWWQALIKQTDDRRKQGTRTISKALTLLTMIFNYAARHR